MSMIALLNKFYSRTPFNLIGLKESNSYTLVLKMTTATSPFKAKQIVKPKGNLTKAVVMQLVPDVDTEKLQALFTSPKNNQVVGFASRARTIEVLGLSGLTQKAVEEYTYPPKRKPRKVVVKRNAVEKPVTKDDYKDFSNDKLISSIKEFKIKLKAMEDQLAERLK